MNLSGMLSTKKLVCPKASYFLKLLTGGIRHNRTEAWMGPQLRKARSFFLNPVGLTTHITSYGR